VGKTTVSAALALRLAEAGRRVAVLTIDPARRLADSLGLGLVGNEPVRVNINGSGSLWAIMLDARRTFDELVERHAPDPQSARRVLDNRYYQFAASRLGGSHEYMAMERLLELQRSGLYDVVVLDTPPTRHALDFLKAPQRMRGLMDQSVLRWLVAPAKEGGWRALELGTDAAGRVLRRLLGGSTIGEIADFFEAFRGLGEGMGRRSEEVQALLRGPRCRFLLVTSPAPTARSEALFFLSFLQEQGLPFGGFLVNRVAPLPEPVDQQPGGFATPELEQLLRRVVREARTLGQAQRRAIEGLQAARPEAPCYLIPEEPGDVHDLDGLRRVAKSLPEI
jgi:anion-transporting  ArsA/GET3 family ATPase